MNINPKLTISGISMLLSMGAPEALIDPLTTVWSNGARGKAHLSSLCQKCNAGPISRQVRLSSLNPAMVCETCFDMNLRRAHPALVEQAALARML